MRCGGTPEPVQAPPAVVLDDVTNGYVPWSMSRNVPCAPSNKMSVAALHRLVQQHDRVGDERLQIISRRRGIRRGPFLNESGFAPSACSTSLFSLMRERSLPSSRSGSNQVNHAQTDARRLVAVGRADAALGGADLVFALEHFPLRVQLAMIRKDHVRRFAHDQIVRRP